MVIASKVGYSGRFCANKRSDFFEQYTSSWKTYDTTIKINMNYCGNNMKNMLISVDQSLKKLHTNYIDILYIHWWDWETSIEELMNGLHNLVAQGKVLYLVSIRFVFSACLL